MHGARELTVEHELAGETPRPVVGERRREDVDGREVLRVEGGEPKADRQPIRAALDGDDRGPGARESGAQAEPGPAAVPACAARWRTRPRRRARAGRARRSRPRRRP